MSQKHSFIPESTLIFLINALVAMIKQVPQVNITTTVNENSTNQQVPGAAAVYNFVVSKVAAAVTGSIKRVDELPRVGDPMVLYFVRGNDNKYSMYFWDSDGDDWIALGEMEINLDDFWSKEELVPMTSARVQEILDAAVNA